MMRATVIAFALFFAGCATVSYPLPTDPTVVPVPNEGMAWYLATMSAQELDGEVYVISPTGSMRPTLQDNDYVCIVEKPFPEYVPYKILLYDADWMPPGVPDVIHRIVLRDAYGLVMAGDNNRWTESQYRVTEKTAKGELVGIWRIAP